MSLGGGVSWGECHRGDVTGGISQLQVLFFLWLILSCVSSGRYVEFMKTKPWWNLQNSSGQVRLQDSPVYTAGLPK